MTNATLNQLAAIGRLLKLGSVNIADLPRLGETLLGIVHKLPPAHEEPQANRYLCGQRVIVSDHTIATFSHYQNEGLATETVWVVLPDGVTQWRDPKNVKPLPGGQL